MSSIGVKQYPLLAADATDIFNILNGANLLVSMLNRDQNGFLCDGTKSARIYSEDAFSPEEEIQILVYPNPSSSDVTIQFEVPEDARVTLDIFNLTGQCVSRIFDNSVEKGLRQKVQIQHGELSPGTYIYRLCDHKKIYQGKIIIMK